MAGGKEHFRLSGYLIWGLIIFSVLLISAFGYLELWAMFDFTLVNILPGLIVGSLLGRFITPDRDLSQYTHEEIMLHRLFPAISWIVYIIYTPYAKYIPHRKIGHTWPTGTLLRAGCLLAIPILALIILLGWWWGWVFVFLGWSAQDLGHLWLDEVPLKMILKNNGFAFGKWHSKT